jgi:hypothetical protein
MNIRDVVFGRVVSGRNGGFPNADRVLGPTWQYLPHRVTITPGMTGAQLLRQVEQQQVLSVAYEGMGLTEIIEQCTSWPRDITWFDSVVHQDVEHVESLEFLGGKGKCETVYPHPEVLKEWKLQAFPSKGGNELMLEIVTFESWKPIAHELLKDLEVVMDLLVKNPDEPLFQEAVAAEFDEKKKSKERREGFSLSKYLRRFSLRG